MPCRKRLPPARLPADRDRASYRCSASAFRLIVEFRLRLFVHEIDEVLRAGKLRLLGLHLYRSRHRLLVLLLRQIPVLAHQAEDDVAPLARAVRDSGTG